MSDKFYQTNKKNKAFKKLYWLLIFCVVLGAQISVLGLQLLESRPNNKLVMTGPETLCKELRHYYDSMQLWQGARSNCRDVYFN